MCSLEGIEGFVKADKLCRRLILLQDECEVRNFVVDFKPFLIGKEIVDITSLFRYLGERGTALLGYEFEFLDLKVKVRPLEQQTHLRVQYFVDHVIRINRKLVFNNVSEMIEQTRSSAIEPENHDQHELEKSEENQKSMSHKDKNEDQQRKRKEKQRKIKNAIECVKVWRGIYQASNHKVSLMETAKLLKISKKSLDDYFLQIRLGQLYGFDFIKNLNKGIGVLRAFIKEKSNKEMESNVPKAIKSYDLVREYDQLKKIYVQDEESIEGKVHQIALPAPIV